MSLRNFADASVTNNSCVYGVWPLNAVCVPAYNRAAFGPVLAFFGEG